MSDLLFLAKALTSKKSGVSRGGPLTPGRHTVRGTLNYDITVEVGEDTVADRSYGVPCDDILNLASHLCGALRPHLHKAAAVVTELTRAKLEGRTPSATSYEYAGQTYAVPAEEVEALEDVLTEPSEGLAAAIKVPRPYAGPVRIVEALFV